MIGPLKFDKRLTTHLIQRGELSTEELKAHIDELPDSADKAMSARREEPQETPSVEGGSEGSEAEGSGE